MNRSVAHQRMFLDHYVDYDIGLLLCNMIVMDVMGRRQTRPQHARLVQLPPAALARRAVLWPGVQRLWPHVPSLSVPSCRAYMFNYTLMDVPLDKRRSPFTLRVTRQIHCI